jgi:hypothetical protein
MVDMDKRAATEITGGTDELSEVKNLLDTVEQPTIPAADVAEEKVSEETSGAEKTETETETERVQATGDEMKASEFGEALVADLSPKAGYAPRLLRRGDVIDVSVVKLERDGVMVNAGGKGDYYIPLNRLTTRTDVDVAEIASVGETMKVAVVKEEDEQGTAVLSKLKADQEGVWTDVEKYFNEQTIVTAKVTKAIKGASFRSLRWRVTIATTCLRWLDRTSLSRSRNLTRSFVALSRPIGLPCRLYVRNRRRNSSRRSSQVISTREQSMASQNSVHSWISGTE